MKNQILLFLFLTFLFTQNAEAQHEHSQHSNHSTKKKDSKIQNKTVIYHLNVNDTVMEIAGKKAKMLTTNGQIPAPTLEFVEGDTALIYVKNNTKGTTSFHWHGLILPNQYDGVPLLTTELIKAGETHIFKFPIIQNGTYWYHSHTMYQEQKGLYGGISIAPKEPIKTKEKVIVLSDFTDQNPHNVIRLLKRHTDWYAIKRNAIQSYGKAIATGNLAAKAWLEWKRMPDMDLADVYYDAFLANGKIKEEVENLKAGETIRLRIINGSSSSHFWLHYAGGKMKIVAADGIDVEPTLVDKLLIATAETYDIEVTIPQNADSDTKKYEFRATSWDRYKYTSVWLGDKNATQKAATDLPPLDYFALVNEMKDMMKMMPKMKMGKAPKNRMENGFYANGKAPTNHDILMEDMNRMGMQMGNGNKEMEHGGMKMNNESEKMNHDKMNHNEMKHDKMEMDTSKMNHQNHDGMNHDNMKMQEGKIHEAEKEGMMMSKDDPKANMMKSILKPIGVMMTGYKQLKEQNPDETIFDYTMLKSPNSTKISEQNEEKPVRIVHLYLGGNMLRYVWMINNTPLSEADKIKITKGETVRFVMHNTTMMSHPMHLHGHFFRIINGQGDFAPLKHTVNVAPMETTIIEFDAIEEKDWFFHCHLLYHMMSGMARVVNYQNTTPMITTKAGYRRFAREDKKWYAMANLTGQTNGLWADASIFNFRNEISIEGNTNYTEEFEVEAKAMHYFGAKQFFTAYLGTEIEQEEINRTSDDQPITDAKMKGLVGIRYFLPMHVWSDFRADHEGNFQVELEREDFPLTKRWRANASVEYLINQDEFRYTIGTSYILGQYFALSANYDNRYKWGAGLQIMY
ncbi:multicopper oxidase domain-containing protein [Bernardetia sp. MNP-M8]|uniref:multicopper oxidase domain-containing protein n=1 Tax=Bernardetia sp. MNP-M8 TaxID=3127470 RepID=UPI0030D2E6F2